MIDRPMVDRPTVDRPTVDRPTVDWPSAFLAFAALLGETVDASAAALAGRETPASRELERQLRAPSKLTRARAMARIAASVVADVTARPTRGRP
jgi:hypothetical protein